MWNHGPVMWSAIDAAHIETPKLSPEDAADLFAFFYSARYFDQPGDAARGQQTFAAHQCGVCHGIEDSRAEGAPPVVHWESLADPVMLVRQMWNHSDKMHGALRAPQIGMAGADIGRAAGTSWRICARSPRRRSWHRAFRIPAAPAAGRSSKRRAASIATKGTWRWRIGCTI
ncbi:MAG: hypothetical protein WDO73_07535 [Ignavibacteriota bacterium]